MSVLYNYIHLAFPNGTNYAWSDSKVTSDGLLYINFQLAPPTYKGLVSITKSILS